MSTAKVCCLLYIRTATNKKGVVSYDTAILQHTLSIGACVCDVVQTVILVGSLGQQTKEQIGWK